VRGNRRVVGDDQQGMDCDRCREAISAALDGEADAAERAGTEAHLAGCPACRAWQHEAAAVTRRARTGIAGGGPDLAARVVAHAPGPRARWRGTAARVGLAVVGVAQAAIGVVSLLGAVTHAHAFTDPLVVLGAGIAHATHESAAWNLALGVAFLVGALWSRHLAGLLPVLGAFIAVLGVVSGLDLVAGRVDPGRVASHLLLVAGFVLGLAVVRTVPRPGPGPTPGARWWRRDEPPASDGPAPGVADRWERDVA
jgi:predicted anti-sigma-YlaC factor YlaD